MSDNLANPAPLGLMGFGMTTILLNLHNAGLFEISAVIMAMGIFYGGFAQVIAGCMEFKKGNTFGTTAFTSYGLFWLTLVFLIYFNGKFGMPVNSLGFLAWYLFMWGLFTFFMWIGTWKLNRGLQVVFLTLTILFWMLAARDAFGWTGTWAVITGYEGIFCGASAIYCAMAQVLNENFGKVILPLGAK
ncbi:MAG: acetate uptake transporter [Deltaproteobacteria bacterium]|nr:acetate uptake transporter [Deltaproteobacteria bacterium]